MGEAPGKAGKVLQMNVLYGDGLASHADPDSCLGDPNVLWDALTGEGVGRWGLEGSLDFRGISTHSGTERGNEETRRLP